jgi:DNA-binding transcriptional ArsR family regulator
MLTEKGDDGLLMVSVTEAARIKGVAKQTISRKLARLEREGLVKTAQRGREKIFSLAQYDLAANEITEPARLVARATSTAIHGEPGADAAAAERDPTYTEELRRKAGFEADLKQLQLERERGRLLDVEDATNAMARCAEVIVRDIDQLPTFADDLMAAFNRGGVSALRDELKKRVRQLRETLHRSLTLLASAEEEDEAEERPQ